ncbi:MAG: TPM domain-containing protein [Clostridia bacterium]|nr:TPM domain-containing protein [Clostridia bacterium]
MVKKLLCILLLLLVPVLALADALSELADTQVIDDAGLFTPSELADMAEIIDQVERDHQVDIVVLTTWDVPDDYSESMYRVRDYADNFYDNGGYGMGEDDSGMLILLDMNNRVMWLSTGGVMIDYITDSREEDILDAASFGLSVGDYGDAMIAALKETRSFMNKGRLEGTFRYDEVTGQRLSGMYNALTGAEAVLAGIAGVAAAAVFVLVVKSRYSLAGSTYSYDLETNAECELTRDNEQYLRQTVTRHARSSGNGGGSGGGRSGGSGVHRSSGGVSHGGGGRRF